MNRFICILVSLIYFISSYAQVGYKFNDKFVNLVQDESSLLFVQFVCPKQVMNFKGGGAKELKKNEVFAKLSKNSFIVNSASISKDGYISKLYKDEFGHRLFVLPRLAVKLNRGYSINTVLEKYFGILSFDKVEYGIYRLDCNLANEKEILKLNQEINEMGAVEWCEPMFFGEAFPLNYYYPDQYYLYNSGQHGGTAGIDINVQPAWNSVVIDTTLIVAVLDDGVERNHEDLVGSVLEGMTIDFPEEKGDPKNEYNNYIYYDDDGQQHIVSNQKAHGTACAGIVAAHNNDIGIRGVASGVKILPINIDPYAFPIATSTHFVWYEKVSDAIRWAYNTKKADIINCAYSFSYSTLLSSAINEAVSQGRDGKGCIVVCPTGNSFDQSLHFPASLESTIAVGAVDKSGVIWEYSGRGNCVDIVAPSSGLGNDCDIITTDRSGEGLGYDYFSNYAAIGGTSASCAQVAGVIALVLSANKSLTAENIKYILHSTARDLGPSGFDTTYGYGLVDAYAAVNTVAPKISGSTVLCDTHDYSIDNLPTGADVSWALSVNGSSTAAQLSVNTPAVNQCRITRSSSQSGSFSATLTATITYQNDTIKVLSKSLDGPAHFVSVLYTIVNTVESGGTGGMVGSYNNIDIKPNTTYYLFSPYFVGKRLIALHDSPIVGNYMFSRAAENAFYVMVPQDGNMIAQLSDGCTTTTWSFWGHSYAYNMSISGGNGQLTVEITQEDLSSSENRGAGTQQKVPASKELPAWTLEVYEATTFKKMSSAEVNGNSRTLDTSSWPKGIYIVRAIVDKEILSEKITIQ